MPATVKELVDLLDLETIDLNLFRGQQPDTRMQRVFGGQVAAQALVAANRTVSDDLAVHSLHSYFLRPGDTAVPIVYDVERLRDGRSFSTRRVLARQHGRPIYVQTASFQVEEDGFEHQDRMPDLPDPDHAMDLTSAGPESEARAREEWLLEWSALELRYAGGARPRSRWDGEEPEDRPARARFWVRVGERLPDEVLVHRAALTYISDLTLLGATLVPHGLLPGSPGVQAASLDHAVWFHRPFRADEWLMYDEVSPSASGARGLAFGHLFTQDGTLVASVAQEGLIRPRPENG
jgi:acyl-CoA thioesterase-2